ncbi:SDR family NAD(P)-dependent oxidoreductase [Aurantimicrobium minutum]|jgi:NAD(P)-dependent dehydrogenase (short-subunit alcohol dehydrogenase family)|uniref:SDR family NAD(P)-dependent oxidoreductase n=1 Tax=Aurantimicrobium minutum TaxID=708131 RepID=UPI0024772028|nr:glucose 1-dehydrogenase [Aurantimicrobium minutum]MDH6537158.1 NAD(P)-dependent dehydrogenase (short-subunit alcohol dehydrogenase family) [Aurantimicrobium minutum]
MSPQLTGKTVIITGAAGGLGRAFALGFAREGANLVIADMNAAGAAETVALVEAEGAKAIAVSVNVADKASCEAMVQSTLDAFGSVDVLVNNAAIYATLERSDFWDIDPDEWDKVMAVNVKGPWLASAACYKHMDGGAIINIASATFFSGSPLWMHYVTSKGALVGMTRVMAREAGAKNVTVNAIAPGFTLTEASLAQIDDAANYGVSSRSIKRASQPEDIVGTALFLASQNASYITGQTIIVDGGKQFI